MDIVRTARSAATELVFFAVFESAKLNSIKAAHPAGNQ